MSVFVCKCGAVHVFPARRPKTMISSRKVMEQTVGRSCNMTRARTLRPVCTILIHPPPDRCHQDSSSRQEIRDPLAKHDTRESPRRRRLKHAPTVTVCKRNHCSTPSCRSTDVTQQSSQSERQRQIKSQHGRREREREAARDRCFRHSPLPLPPLTCKQASATRRGKGGGQRRQGLEGGGVHSPASEAYGPSRGFAGTVKQHQLLAPVRRGHKCQCNGCVSLFFGLSHVQVLLRVQCLTCGGIEAGTSESCVQPGSVSSLGGCCRQEKQYKSEEKGNACVITYFCARATHLRECL